jgi:hypothetical protein
MGVMRGLEPNLPETILKSKYERREDNRAKLFDEVQKEYKRTEKECEIGGKFSESQKVSEKSLLTVYFYINFLFNWRRKKSVY